MPTRSIMSLVLGANIICPPCRLHKQHHVTVSRGNILKPRLPLVGILGMFFQCGDYLLDGRRVILPENLVSDDPREHMAGDVPSRSGEGQYGKREKYQGCDYDTVTSYAIFDEQRARKNALDNGQ
jgi:hypothetical protein